MTKQAVREEMVRRGREYLAAGHDLAAESAEVISRVERTAGFEAADVILCYMDIPGEVRTSDVVRSWYERGKKVVLPVVVGDVLELREYDPACMRPGYRGIMEPTDDAAPVDPSEVDLALVPGVAFTADGMRLGRGKGYYDRLLPQLNCPVFGLCYRYRIVDSLPVDPWDVPLDTVVTA